MDKKLNTFEALKSCSSDRSVEYHSTCGKYIMHRGREKHGSNVYISDTIGGKQDKILWNQAISTFGVLHIRWKLPEEEKNNKTVSKLLEGCNIRIDRDNETVKNNVSKMSEIIDKEKKLHPLEIESGLKLGEHICGTFGYLINVKALLKLKGVLYASVETTWPDDTTTPLCEEAKVIKALFDIGDKHEQS